MWTLAFKQIDIDLQSWDQLNVNDYEVLWKLDDELVKKDLRIKISFVESKQKFKIDLNINQQNIEIICHKIELLFLMITIDWKMLDQNWIWSLESDPNGVAIITYHKERQTLSYQLKINNLKTIIEANCLQTMLYWWTWEINLFVNKSAYEKSDYEWLINDQQLLQQLKMNKFKLCFISSNKYDKSQLFYKTNDSEILIDGHQINMLFRSVFSISDKLLRDQNVNNEKPNIFFNKNNLINSDWIEFKQGFGYQNIWNNEDLYDNIINFKEQFKTVNFVFNNKIVINNLITNDNLQLIFNPRYFASTIYNDQCWKFCKALVDHKESLGTLKIINFFKDNYYNEGQRFEFKKQPALVILNPDIFVDLWTILMKYIELFNYIDLDNDNFYQGFFKYEQTKPVLNKIIFNRWQQQLKACFINGKKEIIEINLKDIIERNFLPDNDKEKILGLIEDISVILKDYTRTNFWDT